MWPSGADAAGVSTAPGGAGATPAPAVALNPVTEQQYVFWQGAGGRLRETWYDDGWHGPVDLGWRTESGPAVGVTNSSHQYVFWRGRRGDIYEAWNYGGPWHGPMDLTSSQHWGVAGRSSSAPAVAVNPATGAQYLFWRGDGGQLFDSSYAGRWGRPVGLGWRSASAPAAAVTDAGRVEMVWRTAGGDIDEAWHQHRWHGPDDLTASGRWGSAGRASSAPAIASEPAAGRHLYLFWRSAGGQLHKAWYASGWHGPRPTGWRAASPPAAAVSDSGHRYVFWQAGDGYLTEASFVAQWTGPVARWSVRGGTGPYVEVVQTSAENSQRMAALSDQQFTSAPPASTQLIDIDDSTRYQSVTGVGGAMTDSAAWLIDDALTPVRRAALIDDLFGADGIHLSFAVVPIGASDFTRTGQPYSYDEMPPGAADPSLAQFSIAHDESYIIPALRQMLAANPQTEIFGVPWSPPTWMKANAAFDDSGGHGTLLAAAYQPLANYFVKFLQAYARAGVPVSAIAPENEPDAGSAFPAMSFPESDEARWITQDLGPALAAAGLTPKVYGGDTGWGSQSYAPTLASSQAQTALAGIAWHCYGGAPEIMSAVHGSDPSLDQLVTECAPNLTRFPVPEVVIGAIRNWASAVTLWNLALNPQGEPVQPPNSGCQGCRGIVTISEANHTFKLNRSYYELGQFGAFVEPGAVRIASNSFVSYYDNSPSSYGATAGIDDVAFLNPDGGRVLVAYNNSRSPGTFSVAWDGRSFSYTLAAGATVTFRWEPR